MTAAQASANVLAQGTNDFYNSHADAGLYCGPAYAPLVANRSLRLPLLSFTVYAAACALFQHAALGCGYTTEL